MNVGMIKWKLNKLLPIRERWPLWLRIVAVKHQYKRYHGRKLNLINPQRFTEKIQWYRLFYVTEDMTRACDKVSFKQYINEHIGGVRRIYC